MKFTKTNYQFRRTAIYQSPKNKFQGKLPHHLPAEIAALFREGQQSWILEIGCGAGQNREFFESRGYRYVGIDIRPNGPDVVCDAHLLPFKSETFNAAVTFSTLEHLWNPFLAVGEVH
ncbi:MAG: class I SAM-dependent methyltransferase, partial [Candidatus Hodarchaeota archaeon]